MHFIADFHIHSHFSLATSKNLTPPYLHQWAHLKGITVIGTGDFTHPGWTKQLLEELIPAEEGLFQLKPSLVKEHPDCKNTDSPVRFLLTAEISTIYKKKDKLRKVHSLICAPDFETVEKIQKSLIRVGANITSDGRPIIGMDVKDLLKLCLDASDAIAFIPAHIWTPWFSVLGEKSGFDSFEECFDEYTKYLFAVETGLSTDAPMNWMCSFLDPFTLISNSDAHSPDKLGRNATIFDTDLSYSAIIDALKKGTAPAFQGTIDLFPQEGKYHYDGHRNCGIVWNPLQSLEHDLLCSCCGKKITVGVMHRIALISDRDDILKRPKKHYPHYLIPLQELLAEILFVRPSSKKVEAHYFKLLKQLGSELDILLNIDCKKIAAIMPELGEAISRVRSNQVYISEGFDGQYGKITVFDPQEIPLLTEQQSIFTPEKPLFPKPPQRKMVNFDLQYYRLLSARKKISNSSVMTSMTDSSSEQKHESNELNTNQSAAAQHTSGPALVIAGPGTGKTKVLIHRIQHLVNDLSIDPASICAITFTTKAAEQIRERLEKAGLKQANRITVCTFHSLGYSILKKHSTLFGRTDSFTIINDMDKKSCIMQAFNCTPQKSDEYEKAFSNAKQQFLNLETLQDGTTAKLLTIYEKALQQLNVFDIDDLIYSVCKLFASHPEICHVYQTSIQFLLIDEFQDINSSQAYMLYKLAPPPDANIFAIGDPNQAIYGFRGSDVKFMNEFLFTYPQTVVFHLNTSYRCSNIILKASEQVLCKQISATEQVRSFSDGPKITLSEQKSEHAEAEYVARTISSLIGGTSFFAIDSKVTQGNEHTEIQSLKDIAVLFRFTRLAAPIMKAFNDHKIPYQALDDQPFYQKQPFIHLQKLLKLSSHRDNESLWTLIAHSLPLSIDQTRNLVSALYEEVTLTEKIEIAWNHLIQMQSQKNPDSELLDDFKEYKALAQLYSNTTEFIAFLEMGKPIDTFQTNIEAISLLTLHAAKGLEFAAVFIIGCEQGIIPYTLFEKQTSPLEEEKRLFYVGMTRAKKLLYLSHCTKRHIFGKQVCLGKSVLLDPIEQELLFKQQTVLSKKKKQTPDTEIQLSLFDD